MATTLYDKIWKDHLVDQQDDGTALLFVDRHLVHEVTSPQAFEGLRNSKRKVRHPNLTLTNKRIAFDKRKSRIADFSTKMGETVIDVPLDKVEIGRASCRERV